MTVEDGVVSRLYYGEIKYLRHKQETVGFNVYWSLQNCRLREFQPIYKVCFSLSLLCVT